MGNALCMPMKDMKGVFNSSSKRQPTSPRKATAAEEELHHRQALATAIQQLQLSQRFDGSMSRRIGSGSSRRRNLSDSFSIDKQQVAEFIRSIETKTIVLIHGEGFGAWCWYKSMSLLEEAGLSPVALDLAGSGVDQTNTNSITTLGEYAKPLTDFLEKLPSEEKVILVGHSCGGASISYAAERFPDKVSKAVFLAATMVSDGQRVYDIFAEEIVFSEIFKQDSQFLMHDNGKDRSPTALVLQKDHIKELYFNQSPLKDISLATVSVRPIPLKPMMEKISLTPENYGSVKRYFIQALDDRMLSPGIQEKMVHENPPHGVYKIKGGDHCPFFSKPQSLNKILLEIAQIL